MLKLYRGSPEITHYWETWDNKDGSHTVHWGRLGDTGQSKRVESSASEDASKLVQSEKDERISEGFRPLAPEEHRILLIEFAVDGHGDGEDLSKRHSLEDRLDETLGWTGLGACDGGSIGSGSMEVCCFVVDFPAAKAVIEKDLEGTEFSNYTRIYDEGAIDQGP